MTVEKPKEKFGHLNPATSALFICDIQEKFETSIELFEMVVTNVERMVQVANILKIPTVTTEQYPKVSHVISRENPICIQKVYRKYFTLICYGFSVAFSAFRKPITHQRKLHLDILNIAPRHKKNLNAKY